MEGASDVPGRAEHFLRDLAFDFEPFSGWIAEPYRFVAPFEEIYEDMVAFALQASDRLEALAVTGAFGTKAVNRQLEELKADLFDSKSLVAREARYLMPFFASTILLTPSSPLLVMCGVAVKSQLVQAFVAGGMCYFTLVLLRRYNGEDGEVPLLDRRVLKSAAAITALGACCHAVMAACEGLPVSMATAATAHFAFPWLALQYGFDILAQPLVFYNLAHLTGASCGELALPMICTFLTSSCNLAATSKWSAETFITLADTDISGACVLLAISGGALYCLSQEFYPLAVRAAEISEPNRRRVKLTGDLLTFSLSLYPLTQALAIAGLVGQAGALNAFAAYDVLSKVGACHTMTRERFVLDSSSQASCGNGGAQHRRPGVSSDEEPCSEPD